MAFGWTLPQEAKIVEAITPQVGGAITGDYVSLKNYQMAYIIFSTQQANAATIGLTVEQATTVAGGSSTAITVAEHIWANEDTAATDTLVKQTSAVSFTTSAAVKNKIVIFRIDPANLAVGFDCIVLKTGASNVANITGAIYVLVPSRYEKGTPPSAILD